MEIIQLTNTKENHDEIIQRAKAVLADGGIVIFPTETCYGVGVDATSTQAVERVLSYKSKRKDKPLSVAVTDRKMAEQYVEVNPTAANIYDHMLPGPVTVVSKGLGKFAPGVESSMGTQGIRIPDYPLVVEIVRAFGKPITSTSANASYKKTPYTIQDILDNISDRQKELIGLIIDAGELPRRKPSTVVDTTLDNIHIVREGAVHLDVKDDAVDSFEAASLEDTERFVHQLFASDPIRNAIGKQAIVFLLEGDLGAGKTHFSKFVAKELGITDVVVSPTFNICREYKAEWNGTPLTFQHMDTYRMFEPAAELEALRAEDLFGAPNVAVVEWANKVADVVDRYLTNAIVVTVQISVTGETSRRFAYTVTDRKS